MGEDEIQGAVSQALSDAEDYADEVISPLRAEMIRYYKGEPFGDEKEGQSQFVSRDVRDVVAKLMPSVMRVFFGSERVVEYVPRSQEDAAMAAQATDYVNHIIREDNDGFGIFYSVFKDALLLGGGFVKWWWDESTEVRSSRFSGIAPEMFAALASEEGIEVTEQELGEDGLITCTLQRKVTTGRVRVSELPPEEFIINRRAKSLDDATLVGHRCHKTVSELVAMGYDYDEMLELSGPSEDIGEGEEREARDAYSRDGDERDDPAMQTVLYRELYMRLDVDGDGIAELRKICVAGEADKIVHNEPWDCVPFADACPDPTPHTFHGDGPGPAVKDVQRIKSHILRLANDSMVQEVHPREWAVEGQVNMDDWLNGEIGAGIRVRAPGMIGTVPTGNSAPTALQFAQFYDTVIESRTGQSKASAGLGADALQSTTRAAVEMTREGANDAKELIVRLLAERCMKRVFKGILRLVVQHQDRPRTVRLRNQWVDVDPRSWDVGMDVSVNVGLGFGNREERQAAAMGHLQLQQSIMEKMGPGNPLVSLTQIYNTLEDLCRVGGQEITSRYYSQPDPNWQPPQPPPPPDPNAGLIEAEKIKAQAKLQSDMAKIAADRDAERDKMILQAIQKAIETGATPQDAIQWGQVLGQIISQPRVDQGTLMQ